MHWPDEIRDPSELLPPPVDVSEEENRGALALMESMSRDDLEGDDFKDTYTEAMAKIIESKRENKPLPEAPEPEKPGKVLDLMAALTESVQKAKASRGEDADVHELPKPKKKTASRMGPGIGDESETPDRLRRRARPRRQRERRLDLSSRCFHSWASLGILGEKVAVRRRTLVRDAEALRVNVQVVLADPLLRTVPRSGPEGRGAVESPRGGRPPPTRSPTPVRSRLGT
ncbi:hypothetical protein ACIA6D_45405 [Streptomyces cacaoi]